MAKRLSAADRVARLKAEGYSNAQIGRAIGRSETTVRRIARGETSGAKALPALRDFGKAGKRAKADIAAGRKQVAHKLPPAPKARPKPPAPAPAPKVLSPLDRAIGQFAALDRGGVEKVMVHVTSKKTGRGRTLWAKGGIEVGEIRGNLRRAMEKQADRQGNNSNISDPEIDWDDVADIDFEEYY